LKLTSHIKGKYIQQTKKLVTKLPNQVGVVDSSDITNELNLLIIEWGEENALLNHRWARPLPTYLFIAWPINYFVMMIWIILHTNLNNLQPTLCCIQNMRQGIYNPQLSLSWLIKIIHYFLRQRLPYTHLLPDMCKQSTV
jgi:hypothetical protein